MRTACGASRRRRPGSPFTGASVKAAVAGGAGIVLWDLAVVLLAAKLGGEAAQRLRQPAVLGELLVGVLLGAALLGGPLGLPDLAGGVRTDAGVVLEAVAAFGAVLLLFEVGLEVHVRELRKVGASSAWVALIGIAASFAAGYAASWALAQAWAPWQAADAALPPNLLHVFVGAALTATSVGITARVLADLGQLGSPEARIVLGAAVLDDVGGLLILAVVTALVASGGAALDAGALALQMGGAVGFLVVATALGLWLAPRAFDWLSARFRVRAFPLGLAVAFALAMAYVASRAGLADIVGAFVAGLVLAPSRQAQAVSDQLQPVGSLLIGVFFVSLGMRVDVAELVAYWQPVVLVGGALAVLATGAKLACGWGVVRGQADRLTVGVGMVPRGEVGLIFAGLGLASGLVANWQYAVLLVVVLGTTVVTPIWLARRPDGFTPPPQPTDPGLAHVLDAPRG